MSQSILYQKYATQDEARKVGFEVELYGVELPVISQIVCDIFDGKVTQSTEYVQIVDTQYGEFRIELDSSLMQKINQESHVASSEEKVIDLAAVKKAILSPVITEFVPYEIVTPPLDIDGLRNLNDVVETLRVDGAKGTTSSLAYAFGVHINAAIAQKKASHFLAIIQSSILLHDYMVENMPIDITRRVSQYATAYPKSYQSLVMREDYQPDLDTLIDDYLKHNPTRNRALDMLPCFSWCDEERVSAVIKDELVKARPAFHFRLPNCRIDCEGWNISKELKWWNNIEYISQHHDMRQKMIRAYQDHLQQSWWSWDQWREELTKWLPNS